MPAETHIAQSIAGKGDIGDAGGFGGRWSNGKLSRDGKVDGEIGSASPLAMGVAPFPQVQLFFNTSCFCFSWKHPSFPPLSDYLPSIQFSLSHPNMLVFTFRWPALLCMVTIFLGWLAPVTLAREIKTSEVYKVLTDADQMGGSCTSRMSQVEQLIPEVQQLIDAAVDALDNLLDNPSGFRMWTRPKKLDRKRLLSLAREFLGVEWEEKSLRVKGENTETGRNSKKTLTDFRGEYFYPENMNHIGRGCRNSDEQKNDTQKASRSCETQSRHKTRTTNIDSLVMTPGWRKSTSSKLITTGTRKGPRPLISVCGLDFQYWRNPTHSYVQLHLIPRERVIGRFLTEEVLHCARPRTILMSKVLGMLVQGKTGQRTVLVHRDPPSPMPRRSPRKASFISVNGLGRTSMSGSRGT